MPIGREIRLFEHGFVRLDDAMASDLSVVNSARVSFAKRKDELDDSDRGLIRFLMRDRHGTTFEHNAFRFHIRCPLFVAREWFRHRIGCLTGDTVVTFVDTYGHATAKLCKTLDELWRMWSVGERNGHGLTVDHIDMLDQVLDAGCTIREASRRTGIGRRAINVYLRQGTNAHRDARWRLRSMRLRVLNEETHEFSVGHIAEIVNKGVQPVYRVRLADGKTLTATENHRLLTEDGWMTLREAVGLVGEREQALATRPCRLLVNGVPAYRDYAWMKAQRDQGHSVSEIAEAAGCTYHTVRAWLRRHDLQFSPHERNFPRGHVPWNTGRPGYHLRELDGVPQRKGCRLTAHPMDVVSVEYVGLRQTFDLCVDGPWHNFVANGVVVHNSFNEESARYHQLEGDFYVPAAEDVRSQVGKPGAYSFEPIDVEAAEHVRADLAAHYERAYGLYQELIERGLAKELARCVLPMGTFTQFYWTVNARSLMNFLSLRAADTAQLEIRRYAEAVEELFAAMMPITYEAFVENGRVAP